MIILIILSLLIPGNTRVTFDYRSLNPSVGDEQRWVSNVATASDGSVWFRWQFTDPPKQHNYDVMFWAADNTLRYYSTHTGCTDDGNICADVTTFDPPIAFGPKKWTGEIRSGAGQSTVTAATCKGTVTWNWMVQPTKAAEIQSTTVRTDLPIEHVTITEKFTGGCGTFTWQEDWWWGTACEQNVCASGPVQSKGGKIPWTADTAHWYMTLSTVELSN